MATTEEIRLAHEAIIEIERIRENILNNAADYKTALARFEPAQVIEVMKRDADQFQRRLERLRRAVDDTAIRAKLNAGLQVLGVDPADIRADYQAINTLMGQLYDANLRTAANVNTAADALLTGITARESILGKPLPTVR